MYLYIIPRCWLVRFIISLSPRCCVLLLCQVCASAEWRDAFRAELASRYWAREQRVGVGNKPENHWIHHIATVNTFVMENEYTCVVGQTRNSTVCDDVAATRLQTLYVFFFKQSPMVFVHSGYQTFPVLYFNSHIANTVLTYTKSVVWDFHLFVRISHCTLQVWPSFMFRHFESFGKK